MALKLFRSTGYSSILMAGETRLRDAPGLDDPGHEQPGPDWPATSPCGGNWRAPAPEWARALALALSVAGASAVVISLFGWRKTIKPAATLVLLAAALSACSIWSEGLPVDGMLLGHGMAGLLLPSWPSLLRWQVWALLAGLALVPMIWMWNTPLRRLSGPAATERQHRRLADWRGPAGDRQLAIAARALLKR